MSHCREFEEALWEAAEGRPLPPEAEAHLRACASCRAAARRLSVASQGFEALRAVEAPDPSAAVWGRVARPKRRPVFALAWAAGAVACVVAGTFALRHGPAQHPQAVPPLRRLATAPVEPPPAPQVEAPAPTRPNTAVEEMAQPVKLHTPVRKHATSGSGQLAVARQKTQAPVRREKQQPEAPAQTQVVEAPSGGEITVVKTAADDSCSEAAALTYRAIGRGLVARFLSSRDGTG